MRSKLRATNGRTNNVAFGAVKVKKPGRAMGARPGLRGRLPREHRAERYPSSHALGLPKTLRNALT